MTHNDIYTKFMIEYDKANVTSSYPSLTKFETATILNKAYLALIAQKVTGNNVRRSPFEADIKSISDLQPLVKTTSRSASTDPNEDKTVKNLVSYNLPLKFMYYVSGVVKFKDGNITESNDVTSPIYNATVTLISHENAQRFKHTISNRPWIKNAVAYIEGDNIYVLYDNYENDLSGVLRSPYNFYITYIEEPSKFTESSLNDNATLFELNDTMAEELISLAVLFAIENVESTRLLNKAQIRGLEA